MKNILNKLTGKAQQDQLYEKALHVASVDDCNFYHSTDIPGVGLVEGQWDLREGFDEYLGEIEVVLLASILLHSRSPVAILESCARSVLS